MHGILGFIIKVEKHIEDELALGEIKLKIDPEVNHIRNAITKGKITAMPFGFSHPNIDVGCDIVFDPKITAQQNHKGNFKKSRYLIDEKKKLYHVPFTEYTNFVFAIKGIDGQWINMSDHDILKPFQVDVYSKSEGGIITKNTSYENNLEGVAEMYLPTKQSVFEGFTKGTQCYFKKGIEWLIQLDDEVFYAIRNRYVFTTKSILDDLPR